MQVDTRMLREPNGTAEAERHPLDPLSAVEIETAVGIVRAERDVAPSLRFETVELKEPPKAVLRAYRPGVAVKREAFLAMFDVEADALFEAVVDLDKSRVTSWRAIEGARPTIMPEELAAVERCVKADPRFAEALRRRGIEDVSMAQVDAWSAGNYGLPTRRAGASRTRSSGSRATKHDNGYAQPIEGLCAVVDLNRARGAARRRLRRGRRADRRGRNYAARYPAPLARPT